MSGSSTWKTLGLSALGGILSYEAGKSVDVQNTNQTLTNPDIASHYYGYGQAAANQPVVGAAPQGSGMSTGEIVALVAVLGIGALVVAKMVH